MSATTARPTGFAAAYTHLRTAQKTSVGAPAYSLYVNRPFGRVLAASAFQLGMTPNQVTVVSAVFTFSGIGLLAALHPSWWSGLVVAALLVVGYALDSADGQLSRLRGGGSMAGEWLDHMFDSAKNTAVHLAVLVSAYRFFPLIDRGWLFVPIAFTVVTVVTFFGMLLNDQLARVHRARHNLPPAAKEGRTPLRTLLKLPTDYGFLCLNFALLGIPLLFSVIYALLALGSAGYLAVALHKWFRDIDALDRFETTAAGVRP